MQLEDIVRGNPYETLLGSEGYPKKEHGLQDKDFLILAPKTNTVGRRDATGAFHPGARLFCLEHDIDRSRVYFFDNKARRRVIAEEVLGVIERERPKALIDFSHGYTHGTQFGILSPGHPAFSEKKDRPLWDRFVRALSPTLFDPFSAPVVALFACSTGDDPDGDPDSAPGSGDGSFADLLRDDLSRNWAINCRVVAHTTAGHSWYNPQIKLFEGRGSDVGGSGAEMLYESPAQRRKLVELLKIDWAFCFSFMYETDIRMKLSGGKG